MAKAIRIGSRAMFRAAAAGAAYVGIVFAAGFLLGTLRVAVLAARIGETAAVMLELPIMLAISWIACRWLIARFDVAAILAPRLVMGGLAFAILILAEIGVSIVGFGRTFSDSLGHYRELAAMLGLAGQIAFAAFPALQLAISRA